MPAPTQFSAAVSRTFAIAALALAGASLPAWAMGGGGGGGGSAPSQTAPEFDPAVEYRSGVEALTAERWKDAEKAFRNVLSVAPRDANTNYLMALSKIGRSDYKGAKAYLEKAVRYGPQLIPAHQQLGVINAKLGDPVKAKAELDWLQAQAATCAGTCADNTALTEAVLAVEAALSAGKQASMTLPRLERFSSDTVADSAYLSAVSMINEHRYGEAIAALETAGQALGPHPDVLTYLGFANRKLRRYDLAETYYRSALAVAPGHRGATEYFGEMMLERGDIAGATRMLARLDRQCTYGCAEADELRRWIDQRSNAS